MLHCVSAQTEVPAAEPSGHGRPALIATTALADFDSLPEDRRKLIEGAIAVARESPWLVYTARGSRPSHGGFDCSGAMYFVMRKAGLDPPRSSAAQMQWLIRHDRLHELPADGLDLQHPAFEKLRPGGLLFWGRRAPEADGTEERITHVALYLGSEKRGDLPVMINSTDGRSYRGNQANGYGVYDFRLPSAGSRISFIGYGRPPGIALLP